MVFSLASGTRDASRTAPHTGRRAGTITGKHAGKNADKHTGQRIAKAYGQSLAQRDAHTISKTYWKRHTSQSHWRINRSGQQKKKLANHRSSKDTDKKTGKACRQGTLASKPTGKPAKKRGKSTLEKRTGIGQKYWLSRTSKETRKLWARNQ